MAARHRPDIEIYRSQRPGQPTQSKQDREAYMWPYINLEDLMKPKPLLLLFNNRGRNKPDTFVHSDLQLAHLGETTGATMPAFLNEHTMMFLDRHTPTNYGELVS
jgi:hypothetical protein